MGSDFDIDLSGVDNFFATLVTHGLLWGRYLIVVGIIWAICEFCLAHNIKRGMAAVFCAIIGIICLLAAPKWAGIS